MSRVGKSIAKSNDAQAEKEDWAVEAKRESRKANATSLIRFSETQKIQREIEAGL